MISRRVFLAGGAVGVSGAALYAAGGRNLFYSALTEASASERIDAPTAHRRVAEGKLILIDIRRPDEWAKTGFGEGAMRLDMRREDFIDALQDIAAAHPDVPVALICARGVRSARLNNRLRDAGITGIIDVPEGMLGSAAGPGWIKRGLPLDQG